MWCPRQAPPISASFDPIERLLHQDPMTAVSVTEARRWLRSLIDEVVESHEMGQPQRSQKPPRQTPHLVWLSPDSCAS